MDWKMWKKKSSSDISLITIFRYLFYLISVTTLSLLIPLSFLLLARLSSANYLRTAVQNLIIDPTDLADPQQQQQQSSSYFHSVFLFTSPTLLHALVAFVLLSAFIHTLTGQVALLPKNPLRPTLSGLRLRFAWLFLCLLQACVGLGINATLEAGVSGRGFSEDKERHMFGRLVFFVGLNEAMMHWGRTVVKPVVDDTVYSGGGKSEGWVERTAVVVGCGWLWWMRLRDEVESLVGVVAAKMEVGGVGIGDFVGWWIYYLTVTIGMARIVKGVLWVGIVMFCRRRLEEGEINNGVDVSGRLDASEKV